MSELGKIVGDTIQALEKMQRDGVRHVAVSRETVAELGQAPVRSIRSRLPFDPAQGLRETAPTAAPSANPAALATIETQAKACVKCSELARCRQHGVFGVGRPRAELMFIGEAPGQDEDRQGEPFVGRAGQLLTKIIEAMGFSRGEVYICNVLKCRPPENRTPLPDEVQNCLPFLLAQIEAIQPKVIVGLGATAMRALLDVQLGITKLRGHWYQFRSTPIMPTFHPAYLLRNPPAKREVWEDMQEVVKKLGRELPPASRAKPTGPPA